MLELPVEGGGVLLVEADREEIPAGLVLASPKPGAVAARATRSLGEALAQLRPALSTIRAALLEHAPDQLSVELGVNFGGETGVIVAKGTAEVNLKLTMTWNRP